MTPALPRARTLVCELGGWEGAMGSYHKVRVPREEGGTSRHGDSKKQGAEEQLEPRFGEGEGRRGSGRANRGRGGKCEAWGRVLIRAPSPAQQCVRMTASQADEGPGLTSPGGRPGRSGAAGRQERSSEQEAARRHLA